MCVCVCVKALVVFLVVFIVNLQFKTTPNLLKNQCVSICYITPPLGRGADMIRLLQSPRRLASF